MKTELTNLEKLIFQDHTAIEFQSVKGYRDMLIKFINSEHQGETKSVEKNEVSKEHYPYCPNCGVTTWRICNSYVKCLKCGHKDNVVGTGL